MWLQPVEELGTLAIRLASRSYSCAITSVSCGLIPSCWVRRSLDVERAEMLIFNKTGRLWISPQNKTGILLMAKSVRTLPQWIKSKKPQSSRLVESVRLVDPSVLRTRNRLLFFPRPFFSTTVLYDVLQQQKDVNKNVYAMPAETPSLSFRPTVSSVPTDPPMNHTGR